MNYIDKEELEAELAKSQANDNTCSDRLAEMFIMMADRFLSSRKYAALDYHVKEDSKSFALYKCLRGIATYNANPEGRKANAFSYFTRAIETATWTIINKERKWNDLKEQIYADYVDELKSLGRSPDDYVD